MTTKPSFWVMEGVFMFQVRFLVVLGLCLCAPHPIAVSATELIAGPYLQRIGSDSVTIVWETREAVLGTVEYGENAMQHAVSDVIPTRLHKIQLTSLRANTRYAYRCRWEDRITETFTFRTAPPRGTETSRLGVIGASHGAPDVSEELARRILQEQPELILHAGKLVDDAANATHWRSQFFHPFSMLISRIPILPVWGQAVAPTRTFLDYFDFSNGRSYWTVEYANVCIIGLDSRDSGAPDTEQYRWLQNVLRNNRQRWTVVLLHDPLFSAHPRNPSSETRWEWQRLFQEHEVDLVISGRDHFYHRTDPIGYVTMPPARQRGVVHINTGGGGADLQPSEVKSYTRKRNHVNHFLVLDVNQDRLLGRAIDISGEGFDSFVIDKRNVPGSEEFISFEMIELERELQYWARTMNQRIVSGPEMVDLSLVANIPTRFRTPIQGEVALLDIRHRTGSADPRMIRTAAAGEDAMLEPGQSSWEATPRSGIKSIWLDPGEPLTFNFKTYRPPRVPIYPLPRLQVKLRYNDLISDFRKPVRGFRNNTLIIPAMQVFSNIQLEIPRTARPLVDNGEFTSEILRQYDPQPLLEDFFLDQTASQPKNSSAVRLLHDSNHLFIHARMNMDEDAPLAMASVYHGRNSDLLFNNEHICINIYRNNRVYTFLLCSNGEKYEAVDFEELRETDWITSSDVGRNAWTADIAIPLSTFGGADGDWKIDILRYDRFADQLSTIKPSFGSPPHWPIRAVDVTLRP